MVQTRKPSTKGALLYSVVSLMLCFAMLLGTTYAWFTDSEASANNIIQAGNLDVTFEYWSDSENAWLPVKDSSEIFNPKALWEPGYTDVVYLRVSNTGSLSLKYQLGVNIVDETPSVNIDGEGFKLSDYIYFDVVEGVSPETDYFKTRDEAMAYATEKHLISDGYHKRSNLYPVGNPDGYATSECVAMVVYMPYWVGDEANHAPEATVPTINLGLSVVATQNPYETDDFGNDYDADAPKLRVDTAEKLQEVLNNGGYAVLTADITAPNNQRFDIPADTNATIDLNGYTITSKDGGGSNTMAVYINNGAQLTLNDSVGTGKIVSSCYGVYVKQNARFVMNGGTISVSGNGVYDIGVCAWNSAFIMNGGTIEGQFGVWASNYYRDTAGEAGLDQCYIKISDECTLTSTGYADVEYFDALDAIVDVPDTLKLYPVNVSSSADLIAAVNDSNSVVLASDIVLEDSLTVPASAKITMDLNGHILSQNKAQSAAYSMIVNKGTLNIMDSVGCGKISYADTTVYTNDINYASNTISNHGVLNVYGGTIENISSDNVRDYGFPHTIDAHQGSTTNIYGGTVKSANYDVIRMFCNSTTQATTVNIYGGTIVNRVSFQNPSSNAAGYGILNISGGEFVSTSDVNANVRLLNFSSDMSNMKATITGGYFDKGIKTQSYSSATVTFDTWLTVTNTEVDLLA